MSQQAPQFQRVAHAQTPNASKYLQRLCKHFAHRVSAEWNEQQGKVSFAEGTCHLTANDSRLHLSCNADSEQKLTEIVDTLERHFIRFAKAEAPKLHWQR